jgi:site-specific DNA recombinase
MKNLSGKRAILYRRVSTTDQKLHGYSLGHQKDVLRAFCHNNSIEIDREFEEDYSAKDFIRPQFKQLLEYAIKNKNKIDYLLVHKWDRFSREGSDALVYIKTFKKLGIEVNCIESWIDYDDPAQLMMLHINVAFPEVENRIKSDRVKDGNRKALLEGRWINKQPLGYIKGRDENDKPLMRPHPELSPLVKELFEDFASGLYSQSELLKLYKYKPLKLTRSNLNRIIRQIVYAGKIEIKADKSNPEIIIDGLHQPIISIETYCKVQNILQRRTVFKQKIKAINPYFPLRGHLKCCKCGGNLTGSASTSGTGAKHYYYHCNASNGCNERFTTAEAHKQFFELLKSIAPSKEVCDLFEVILEEKFKTSESDKEIQLNKVKREIEQIKKKEEVLTDKLIEGVLNNEDFILTKKKLKDKYLELKEIETTLKIDEKDLRSQIGFGVQLFQNLPNLFEKASVSLKNKLLSSILEEKLEYKNKKYRTPVFKEVFGYIYNKINALENIKEKTGNNLSKVSRFVPGAGVEPARFPTGV